MMLLNSFPLLSLIAACFAQSLDEPAASEVTSSLGKRGSNDYPWVGQYSTQDCTTFPVTDPTKWQPPHCTDPKSYCVKEARPKLPYAACIPWYPVLTAENGPSVGVFFGRGENTVLSIYFFKSIGDCTTKGVDHDPGKLHCCNGEKALLGSMNVDGTSSFGTSGTCTQIGSQPGANQTLWEARYVMGISKKRTILTLRMQYTLGCQTESSAKVTPWDQGSELPLRFGFYTLLRHCTWVCRH